MEVKINRNQNPTGKEGLKKMINKVRKHINILEPHQRGEIRREENMRKLKGSTT